MCMGACTDMCIGTCTDMCIGMCTNMCIGRHVYRHASVALACQDRTPCAKRSAALSATLRSRQSNSQQGTFEPRPHCTNRTPPISHNDYTVIAGPGSEHGTDQSTQRPYRRTKSPRLLIRRIRREHGTYHHQEREGHQSKPSTERQTRQKAKAQEQHQQPHPQL